MKQTTPTMIDGLPLTVCGRDNATTDAHGTFTLSDPDGSFNVAATLTDVDDTLDPGSRWDGKSLTKEGAGTLILLWRQRLQRRHHHQ